MAYKVDASNIHGVGVIAKTTYPPNSIIGTWMSSVKTNARRKLYQVENMLEPWYEIGDIGRYCNHQINSNTTIENNGNIVLLRSKGIEIGDEITVDYRECTIISSFFVDITGFIEF